MGSCPLTCTACTGGPLGASTRAHIPVQRGLWRGQHPTVTQGGGGRCQGLATQSPSWLVHGIRIGHRHCHMHGEVLLRQCCGLQEGDKHTQRYLHTNTLWIHGLMVVMASLTESDPGVFFFLKGTVHPKTEIHFFPFSCCTYLAMNIVYEHCLAVSSWILEISSA